MDSQFEKMVSMLSGINTKEYMNNQLSDLEKKQIESAIDLMFNGMAQRNWINGGTLSDAWLNALDTVRETVFTFTQTNAATQYARNATFNHRKIWRSTAIASLEGNRTLNCPPEKREAWINDANTKIQNAYEILEKIIVNFGTNNQHAAQQQVIFKPVNFKTIDERENVHERKY